MKKTFFSLCFFFSSAYCAYSGHFAQPCFLCPSYVSFPSGYVRDDISNKLLTAVKEVPDSPTFNKLGLTSNFGLVSVCLLRKFEIFSLLGKTTAHIDWEEGLPFDRETNTHFSWEAGIRGHLFSINPVCFGFSVSYFNVPNLTEDSPISPFIDFDLSQPKSFKLREWQATIGAFVPISIAIPYIGMQYQKTRFDLFTKNPSMRIKYKNKNNIGLVFGICLNFGQKLFLSAEKRYFTEDAYSLSSAFVF